MDDLIAEFLTETNESLSALDMDLVKLEQSPNDKELLGQIFRVIHTVKGTCGFLGLPRLEGVAHKAEDVLGLFRDGELEVGPEYVTLIFESLDRIRYIVGEIEATGEEPEGDDTELIAKLKAVLENAGQETAATPAMPAEEVDLQADGLVDLQAAELEADEPAEAETGPAAATSTPETPTEAEKTETPRESNVANQSLRVNVDVIENLMTMVSELVLTRNQLLQILRTQSETEFAGPLQRLNHVVSDLQEGVMMTRMQPIGNAWAKLPRIIRDICIDLGKKIDLEMKGEDTELDRQVLELIKDPLTHMVRNSADHGIETPEERLAAGKTETGKIKLHSYHEGGHIIIEIADDGRGLATEKIKNKVIANGLASEEELADLSPQQVQQFIFKPGFSTADQVTAVSGRGVGMDVVRTNIEKIGGSVDLKSVEGEGSRFLIKIPLTLAIVSALIVESGKEKFAIPQLSVKELVMTSADGENHIETIKGTPVFRLRGHLLPLISLQELLDIQHGPPASDDIDEAKISDSEDTQKRYANKYIVVAEVGAYMFGIIVDRVFDTEEIVVKPVANILRNIDIFSGNTILGDGAVIMIVDPAGIVKHTGDIDISDNADAAEEKRERIAAQKTTSVILFSTSGNAPKAVPLELVSRLEEIKIENIEKANGRMLVQYRDSLMPLVSFDERDLKSLQGESVEKKPVLVFSDQDQAMGLIVDEIIDIKDIALEIKMESTDDKVLGTAIINDKATDIINVGHFLMNVNSEWFKNHDDEPFETGKKSTQDNQPRRVLLVEDSPFFRNMITPMLQVAGYEVVAKENPADALALCESGEHFDLIVSDIEMPDMDGFEFAETVKASNQWKDIPMVALSSHATPQDISRGTEAGFAHHIAKFDRATLLDTISETLSNTKDESKIPVTNGGGYDNGNMQAEG